MTTESDPSHVPVGLANRSLAVAMRVVAALVDLGVLAGVFISVYALSLPLWTAIPVVIGSLELNYRLDGSIGKWLFGLRVTCQNRQRFYLRETLGKAASCATFFVGFVMALSADGRALHDHIAQTYVVREPRTNALKSTLRALTVTLLIVCASFVGFRIGSHRTSGAQAGKSQSDNTLKTKLPAVVTIYSYEGGRPVVQGSGFLVSPDGIGVTNVHVLESGSTADATLGDGRMFQILRIVAFDTEQDLVLFRLGRAFGTTVEWPKGLPFLEVGSSGEVGVGDKITAISSPEGLGNTVTDGILSAVRESPIKLLQISAPISPGSSGGAILGAHGKVIGVARAQLRSGQNLNFAIPAEHITRLLNDPNEITFDVFRHRLGAPGASGGQGTATVSATRHEEVAWTGRYSGTVHNTSADVRAHVVLTMGEQTGIVFGCMGVQRPLYGSGAISGYVLGDQISFNVTGRSVQLILSGKRSGTIISGTYDAYMTDGSSQEGRFALRQISNEGVTNDFDLSTCERD